MNEHDFMIGLASKAAYTNGIMYTFQEEYRRTRAKSMGDTRGGLQAEVGFYWLNELDLKWEIYIDNFPSNECKVLKLRGYNDGREMSLIANHANLYSVKLEEQKGFFGTYYNCVETKQFDCYNYSSFDKSYSKKKNPHIWGFFYGLLESRIQKVANDFSEILNISLEGMVLE